LVRLAFKSLALEKGYERAIPGFGGEGWRQFCKPIIEANRDVMAGMEEAVLDLYSGLPARHALPLGEGQDHSVYSVGSVADPSSGQDLHIAVRCRRWRTYSIGEIMLYDELAYFVQAYLDGEKPPYFVGVFSWEHDGEEGRHAGIVTEDLTKGKRLHAESDRLEHMVIVNEQGERERFYIDPIGGFKRPEAVHTARKYMEEPALIALPRKLAAHE